MLAEHKGNLCHVTTHYVVRTTFVPSNKKLFSLMEEKLGKNTHKRLLDFKVPIILLITLFESDCGKPNYLDYHPHKLWVLLNTILCFRWISKINEWPLLIEQWRIFLGVVGMLFQQWFGLDWAVLTKLWIGFWRLFVENWVFEGFKNHYQEFKMRELGSLANVFKCWSFLINSWILINFGSNYPTKVFWLG